MRSTIPLGYYPRPIADEYEIAYREVAISGMVAGAAIAAGHFDPTGPEAAALVESRKTVLQLREALERRPWPKRGP